MARGDRPVGRIHDALVFRLRTSRLRLHWFCTAAGCLRGGGAAEDRRRATVLAVTGTGSCDSGQWPVVAANAVGVHEPYAHGVRRVPSPAGTHARAAPPARAPHLDPRDSWTCHPVSWRSATRQRCGARLRRYRSSPRHSGHGTLRVVCAPRRPATTGLSLNALESGDHVSHPSLLWRVARACAREAAPRDPDAERRRAAVVAADAPTGVRCCGQPFWARPRWRGRRRDGDRRGPKSNVRVATASVMCTWPKVLTGVILFKSATCYELRATVAALGRTARSRATAGGSDGYESAWRAECCAQDASNTCLLQANAQRTGACAGYTRCTNAFVETWHCRA